MKFRAQLLRGAINRVSLHTEGVEGLRGVYAGESFYSAAEQRRGYGYFIWKCRSGFSINRRWQQKCYAFPEGTVVLERLSRIEDKVVKLRESMEEYIGVENGKYSEPTNSERRLRDGVFCKYIGNGII